MTFAGIDVSKPHLDLALVSNSPKPTRLRFPNTPEGRQALLAALAHHNPAWVALEPTGPYHLPLLRLLAEKGLPVALVNPYHLAAFRKAKGERNKTDRQDALLLARYAQVYHEDLRAYTLPPETLQTLKALVGYREDLAGREQAILNQMEAAEWAGSREVLALLQKELSCVKALLGEVEARIQALLAALPEAEVLMGLPGVGPQVAAAVLALLPPELWGRAKAAASYAGLIPEREESGKSVERGRLSRKGPPLLRRKLYMGALVAVRHDPEMRAFYHRLLSRGKTKKQALLAVAHKLLRRMMGRLREYYAGQPAQGVA
ncbi:DNA-binding protein (plasmid) [Thermus parvatiensis]|uniref:DNA-binding protein n=2 Tax=Thermus TaxID=270 RepID=A0A0X8D966_9DEIN|nr:IS110 family transposase [Thermus parvatiensis]AMA76337.1 DNA-binding protein [Thermus parvatiensis]AMA76346.1 DNA-binding protein [Thermus parvatiensis]